MSEFYEKKRNTSIIYSDRYRGCQLLADRDTGESLLAYREIQNIPINPNDRYHTVTSNEVNRLDILAARYYKNPLFWWIIAQANDIYDPFNPISPGTILRIPDIESLYGNNGILL